MTQSIVACIDASIHANAVVDCAAWASQQMSAPLTFLHVLPKERTPGPTDLSGNIGLGSREQLLHDLAALDAKRNKLASEQGRLLLQDAKERAHNANVSATTLQRHGNLVETLVEQQANARLFVMGRRGEDTTSAFAHLGSHVERAIRAVNIPLLVTTDVFTPPNKAMVAYDGSPTMRKAITQLAKNTLLQGVELHLVLVGENTPRNRRHLDWAAPQLQKSGITLRARIIAGETEKVLRAYQHDENIGMIVMGAYGHSRIRTFFVGSTTTAMIRNAKAPLLVLR